MDLEDCHSALDTISETCITNYAGIVTPCNDRTLILNVVNNIIDSVEKESSQNIRSNVDLRNDLDDVSNESFEAVVSLVDNSNRFLGKERDTAMSHSNLLPHYQTMSDNNKCIGNKSINNSTTTTIETSVGKNFIEDVSIEDSIVLNEIKRSDQYASYRDDTSTTTGTTTSTPSTTSSTLSLSTKEPGTFTDISQMASSSSNSGGGDDTDVMKTMITTYSVAVGNQITTTSNNNDDGAIEYKSLATKFNSFLYNVLFRRMISTTTNTCHHHNHNHIPVVVSLPPVICSDTTGERERVEGIERKKTTMKKNETTMELSDDRSPGNVKDDNNDNDMDVYGSYYYLHDPFVGTDRQQHVVRSSPSHTHTAGNVNANVNVNGKDWVYYSLGCNSTESVSTLSSIGRGGGIGREWSSEMTSETKSNDKGNGKDRDRDGDRGILSYLVNQWYQLNYLNIIICSDIGGDDKVDGGGNGNGSPNNGSSRVVESSQLLLFTETVDEKESEETVLLDFGESESVAVVDGNRNESLLDVCESVMMMADISCTATSDNTANAFATATSTATGFKEKEDLYSPTNAMLLFNLNNECDNNSSSNSISSNIMSMNVAQQLSLISVMSFIDPPYKQQPHSSSYTSPSVMLMMDDDDDSSSSSNYSQYSELCTQNENENKDNKDKDINRNSNCNISSGWSHVRRRSSSSSSLAMCTNVVPFIVENKAVVEFLPSDINSYSNSNSKGIDDNNDDHDNDIIVKHFFSHMKSDTDIDTDLDLDCKVQGLHCLNTTNTNNKTAISSRLPLLLAAPITIVDEVQTYETMDGKIDDTTISTTATAIAIDVETRSGKSMDMEEVKHSVDPFNNSDNTYYSANNINNINICSLNRISSVLTFVTGTTDSEYDRELEDIHEHHGSSSSYSQHTTTVNNAFVTLTRDVLLRCIDTPSVLIGWEVFVEDMGVGQVTSFSKSMFFATRFEIEFHNGLKKMVPLKRSLTKSGSNFTLLRRISDR